METRKVYRLEEREEKEINKKKANKYLYPIPEDKLFKVECEHKCGYECFANKKQLQVMFKYIAYNKYDEHLKRWDYHDPKLLFMTYMGDEDYFIFRDITKRIINPAWEGLGNWDAEDWDELTQYGNNLMYRIPCPACLLKYGTEYDLFTHGTIENPLHDDELQN
jgi:hypothetical protein